MDVRPLGPYSLFRFAGELVFISGQIGSEASADDVAEQTRSALQNIKKILAGLGLELRDVIKATIFTTKLENFAEINSVWREFFHGELLPSRSTVGVSSLPRGALVEIEVVAYMTKAESLICAGRYHFNAGDFTSARDYFEKAWRKERKSIYRALADLADLCRRQGEKELPRNRLMGILTRISHAKDKPKDVSLKIPRSVKAKLFRSSKDELIEYLKEVVNLVLRPLRETSGGER